jgi:hypothetical protein
MTTHTTSDNIRSNDIAKWKDWDPERVLFLPFQDQNREDAQQAGGARRKKKKAQFACRLKYKHRDSHVSDNYIQMPPMYTDGFDTDYNSLSLRMVGVDEPRSKLAQKHKQLYTKLERFNERCIEHICTESEKLFGKKMTSEQISEHFKRIAPRNANKDGGFWPPIMSVKPNRGTIEHDDGRREYGEICECYDFNGKSIDKNSIPKGLVTEIGKIHGLWVLSDSSEKKPAVSVQNRFHIIKSEVDNKPITGFSQFSAESDDDSEPDTQEEQQAAEVSEEEYEDSESDDDDA